MSTASFTQERDVALLAVRLASQVTSSIFHSLSSSTTVTKSDKSPVTMGDFAAQAVVNTVLGAYFPDDAIVGEEDADDLRKEGAEALKAKVVDLASDALASAAETSSRPEWKSVSEDKLLAAIDRGNHTGGAKGRFWALDPIDGTKGFLRGGQYAICLALIEDGKVKVGAMGCPRLPVDKTQEKPKEGAKAGEGDEGLGAIFWAVEGQGSYQGSISDPKPVASGVKISMSPLTPSTLNTASFCESVEAGHSSHGTNARIAELLGITRPSVRMDSQAKYASIARADGDVYLRLPVGDGSYVEKIWDHASGALLVAEAGGVVSDASGRPLDFGVGRTLAKNKGVVAAHKDIHSRVIESVVQALREEGRDGILKL